MVPGVTDMLTIGQRLWNGVQVTPYLAETYNTLQQRIEGFRKEGLPVPDYLLNAAFKLIHEAV